MRRPTGAAAGPAVGAGGLVSSFFSHQQAAGSSRTLADLQLDVGAAAGEEGGLRDLLASLPERHPESKAALRRRQHAQFGRWWAQLRAGNSLLLYGFGSKHDLLSRFARQQTGDGACLAVNGLHPGLTAKQVRAGLVPPARTCWTRLKACWACWDRQSWVCGGTAQQAAAQQRRRRSGQPAAMQARPACAQILQQATAALKGTKAAHYRGCSKDDMLELVGRDQRRLYLVLHNIDGPGGWLGERVCVCVHRGASCGRQGVRG